jgi:hypothetical protein
VEGVGSQGVLLQLIVIQQEGPVHPAHRQINICKLKELPLAKNNFSRGEKASTEYKCC